MDDTDQHAIEERLRRQIEAYHEAALLFTAVAAGIPDRLQQGPRTADELANDLDLGALPLRRFLRGLVTMRICEELEDGRFALTPAGESLAAGSSSSLREKVQVVVGQYWLPWQALMHSLKTGAASFPFVFGATVAEARAQDKAAGAAFHRYLAKEEIAHADDLMQSFDVFEAETVASIGGGYGGFLVPFLHAFPELKAVVFDGPTVVEGAEPMFQAYGLQDRVALVGGDVLREVPVEADLYILKSVLQQHDDDAARTVLANCRKAMKPGAKLIVYERLMPEKAGDDPAAIMLDLHMMAITGGKARTKAEMEALIAEAGLRISVCTKTYDGLAFIEAGHP